MQLTRAADYAVRVMMHMVTDKGRNELHHVYLEGAKGLRDDLPE